MKKLLLVLFVVVGMNQSFAVEENSNSDCTSLNTSTSDAVVVSNGDVQSGNGDTSGGDSAQQ